MPFRPPHSDARRGASRCCRCNGTAKCLRCACVRKGVPCSSCLPGDGGFCHNSHNSRACAPPTSRPESTCPISQSQAQGPSTGQLHTSSLSGTSASLAIPNLPSLMAILQTSIPTLQHVPKVVRNRWTRILGECLSAVCSRPDDISCWSSLFMLAKCVLASPAAGRRMRWREIFKLVKSRLDRWAAGEFGALWQEAVSGARVLADLARSSPGSLQRSRNIRRAKQASQEGQYRKAIQTLSSEGLASPSAEVLKEMLTKHSQAPQPTLPEGPTPPPAILCESNVLKCVCSFPKGSAPGPSGLHPGHLREATRCPSPDQANRFLSVLTTFVNLLAAGRTPLDVTPYLCGATLLASKKKSGGHRPIAVGEVLRRLVSKCLSFHSRAATNSLLIPLQLGVGVRGGCEAIVHAVSRLTTSLPNDRCWTLMLDFYQCLQFNQSAGHV